MACPNTARNREATDETPPIYLRIMNPKSEIEHWKIKATVYKDRVEEIHYITDPAATFGETEKTQVWRVERSLGVGGFGEVHLQRNVEDRKTRAVKRIVTSMINLELAALLEFSKPKASRI